MTEQSRTQDSAAPGILSSLLRPVFTLAAAAAVALPLMVSGAQAAPVDNHNVADLLSIFNRPAVTQVEQQTPAAAVTVLQPVGEIVEHYSGPRQPTVQEQIVQYGLTALAGTAAVGGAVGIVALGASGESTGRRSHSHANPAANMLLTSMIWGTPLPSLKIGR